ncbi:MAG: patatin-like phospholipase family protein, partial [Myxococcota bacterium]|nr:patatin-like phospholipase family protein [Myxococcota bacterium]
MTRANGRPRIGLVLSGGGARGAYEVGVLAWLAEHAPEVLDAVRVVTGASVGAVNAAFVVSRGVTPDSIQALVDVWRALRVDRVMRFSPGHAAQMLWSSGSRWLGRGTSPPVGLFRGTALADLILKTVKWDEISGQIASGRIDGIAVAATEIASGRTHLFVEHSPALDQPRWPHDDSLVACVGPLRPEHVLASTAIPLVFGPVQVGDHWYTDGGIRQNTPISPALRLGAERLLVLSFGGTHEALEAPGEFPGLGQLLGKLLNSLFLDRLQWDLDRMDRLNDVLEAGRRAYGEGFEAKLQEGLKAIGRRPYHPIRYVNIHPSQDVGVLA